MGDSNSANEGPTTQSHGQQGASTSRVSIKHSTLAWWGGVAGVAALGALIAVAWVTDSDALATTALYLAVLSFLVQLILYVVQAWTTNQQQLRAEQVHHDTAIVLTRIEEIALRINAAGEAQTQSMQDLITRIASRVVGDLRIPDTDESEEAEEPEKPLTNEEIEERVAAAVRRELASNPSIPRYTPLPTTPIFETAGPLSTTPIFTTTGTPLTSGSAAFNTGFGGTVPITTWNTRGAADPYARGMELQRSWEASQPNPTYDQASGKFVPGAESTSGAADESDEPQEPTESKE